MTRLAVAVAALALPRPAAAAEPELSLHVGRSWHLDSDASMFDGNELRVGFAQPLVPWLAGTLEVSTAGEYAGSDGTCLGEVGGRFGGVAHARLGPRWLRARAGVGLGAVFARLYSAPYFRAQGADRVELAWGDRLLPQAWASAGLAAEIGSDVSLHADVGGRFVPAARFDPDHVPEGTRPAHYPIYGRDHDLSSLGASIGLGWRF